VINNDSTEFVKSPDEFRPIEGSIEAIAKLSAAGFTVTVATNQSGIGRGLLDRPALDSIHDKLRSLVRDAGGEVAGIVYCPHLPGEGCACRKPLPGLYQELSQRFGVPLAAVPVVGDSARDLLAARAAGARALLVLTGNGRKTAASWKPHDGDIEIFADLDAAAAQLIAELEQGSA
jgi:D-glycero-D-manno-heptose 1,7-bisphosphate phosphatase